MPRRPRPWFYKQTGWWMVWLGGKKVRLGKSRSNRKKAEQRLLELQLQEDETIPGREDSVRKIITKRIPPASGII